MRAAQHLVAVAVGALLVAALFAGAPATASADRGIWLSVDGATWSHELDRPIFDPSTRWVPGETRASAFLVRNDGVTGASLVVRPAVAAASSPLADHVSLSARLAGGAWVSVPSDRTTELAGSLPTDGSTTRVELRAALDPLAPNRSQGRELDLLIGLVRPSSALPAAGPKPAGFGAHADGWATLVAFSLAALVVGSGAALVVPRRLAGGPS
jgi:hypothetical protein